MAPTIPVISKGSVYISLPTPKEAVIISYINKAVNADLVIDKYLKTCAEIATLEAETTLKVAKAKYGFIWKLVAILGALVFLITGIICGYKLKPYFESMGILAEPTQIERK
jgi:hypothetical protein